MGLGGNRWLLALMSLSVLIGSVSCATALLYCPGDLTANLCPQYATALSQMGHRANIKTTAPLQMSDLYGVDLLIDGETAAGACVSSDSTSAASRASFMGIGKPIFYQLASTSFNECNQAKQMEINNQITDIPVPSGIRLPEASCTMATDVGDRSCILSIPNDIAGIPVTCNSVNSFSDSLDANSALSFSNFDAYAGVWGNGDTKNDARIAMWSGLGWHPSFVDYPVFENIVTYLLNGCDLCSDAVSSPVLSCPSSDDMHLIAGWGSCCGVANYEVTATDADECAELTGPTHVSGHLTGICVNTGDSVTYTVHDSAGNSDICTWEYTIVDYEPPIFTSCPTSTRVFTGDSSCSGRADYETPTASDNCGIDQIVHISGPDAGSTINPGQQQVSYVALDLSGNANTCSFSLEMVDPYPPIVSCPDDVNIPNEAGYCWGVSIYSVPARDNCPVTKDQMEGLPSGSRFPVGTTVNRYEATDGYSRVECSFTVTVNDVDPVHLVCPHPATIEQTPPVRYEYEVQVLDNCDDYTLTRLSGPESGDLLEAGLYTIEYSVVDLGGFSYYCSWTVDVGVADISFPADNESLAMYTNYLVIGQWLADDEFVRIDLLQPGGETIIKSLPSMSVFDMEFSIYDVLPGSYDLRFVGLSSNAHYDIHNIYVCTSFYNGCF